MNNTKTTTLAIAAIFIAVTLVVGATFVEISALAYMMKGQQDNKRGARDNGSGNGNTVIAEKCKNRGSASGFDTTTNQECQNLICTHPGENATCVQEGAAAAQQTPTPQPIPTTTLRIIKNVVCLATDPNCAVPSDFTIGVFQPEQPVQTVVGQSGAGTVVTLVPGMYRVMENTTEQFNAILSGQCSGDITAGQHLTCTVTNTEREP
jgi:hypothetical protein